MSATVEQTQTREIATISSPDAPVSTGYLVDSGRFDHLWRVATAFSKSALVPAAFQGKPADCFVAAQLSLRLGCDLFMLMQNLYIVHGKPGFEAKLAIALLNASGKIDGTVRYRFDGDGDAYGCTAYVTDKHSGELVEGPKVDWATVKGEGWDKPKSGQPSKWTTMPDQMFRYRSATFLIRAHYPEVMMGLQTPDEIEDTIVDVEPVASPSDLASLATRLEAENATSAPAASETKAESVAKLEDALTDEFAAALQSTDTIRGVIDLVTEWKPRFSQPTTWLDGVAEHRKEAIRAARGSRPKATESEKPAEPKPEPEAKPADDSEPTAEQIATRAKNYAGRIAKSATPSALDSAWNDIDSDPYVAEDAKQSLRKLYGDKRDELGK